MDVHLSDLQEQRRIKAEQFRSEGFEPYPTSAKRTHTTTEAIELFIATEGPDGHSTTHEVVTLTGRVVSRRHMGKTLFSHVRDGHGEIQLYIRKDELGEGEYERALKLFDLGDWVQASGELFRTKTGEVSLRAANMVMLSKALNAPPEKWHGLQDVEIRYRQRYADLISSADVRNVFEKRSRIVSAIRHYLDSLGYLEVETPVLQPLYGGAAARPFTTHHNALDQIFYLRIADELYLKRLIVGGYERVYEISKDFRNEGVDRNHSPEFTMLEFYEAFADYGVIMDRVENLIISVVQEAFGTTVVHSGGKEIDVAGQRSWPRITLQQAIKDASGIDYVEYPDAEALIAIARSKGADIETGMVWPRVVDELLKHFVRPYIVEPTFIIDYPVELSPLAKRIPGDPTHAERFQLYIGGHELANAFTELNDPIDQLNRFLEQVKDRAAGDLDAMPFDADFINALMYGMPPTGGVGIGIDRLTMFLTDQTTVRDVILFPAMRNLPVANGPISFGLSEELADVTDEE